MDTSVAAVMVRDVVPEMSPDVAVIIAEPEAIAVASPLDPAALLMVAAPPEELQVTAPVRSCVVPSEYVPVAVNCSVELFAMERFVGVTVIDDKDVEISRCNVTDSPHEEIITSWMETRKNLSRFLTSKKDDKVTFLFFILITRDPLQVSTSKVLRRELGVSDCRGLN
jgi:hypothetical protein